MTTNLLAFIYAIVTSSVTNDPQHEVHFQNGSVSNEQHVVTTTWIAGFRALVIGTNAVPFGPQEKYPVLATVTTNFVPVAPAPPLPPLEIGKVCEDDGVIRGPAQVRLHQEQHATDWK